jgi:hypothetical protein
MAKSSEALIFEEYLYFNKQRIKIFEPSFPVFWEIAK